MRQEKVLKPFNRRLTIEWGDWLSSKEWSLWCTFTTHYALTLRKARHNIEELYALLQQTEKVAPAIFWIAELFPGSSNYHLHAFIKVEGPVEQAVKLVKKAWLTVCKPSGHGKFNKVQCEEYQSSKGAKYYIAKHIQSDKVDYDFMIAT